MYRVIIDGVEIQCESAAAAIELARAAARTGPAVRPPRPAPPAVTQLTLSPSDDAPPLQLRREPRTPRALRFDREPAAANTIRFLQELGRHGSSPVEAKTLASSLQISDPKGLGPVITRLRNEIVHNGLAWDDVVQRVRHEGARAWLAGPRLNEAARLLLERSLREEGGGEPPKRKP
jgi:hypothetical protein